MRPETTKAIEIAEEAGKIAMSYFEQLKDHHISTKDDGSLLTIADLEVDKFIRESLESHFPEHSVLSEESKNERATDGVWIIDPIDGTKNFASGNPNFGISIGLVVNNIPEIGIIFLPAKNKMYVGEKGGNAYCNGEIINVSKNSEIKNSKILIDTGSKEKTVRIHTQTKNTFIEQGAIVEAWQCATAELCSVAEGNAETMIHCRLDCWDISAGIVIVESAGGNISHLDGSPKNIFEPGIVASNGILHNKIIGITQTAL